MGRKRIKKPVKKGVAQVPVIMQLEALECGAASLSMIMAYYNKWVPLEECRIACGVSRDGSKAKNIYLAAEHYGFEVKAFRMTPEMLKEQGTFPCIIHWNMNHFVVLNGFKGKTVYLNDPARGAVKVTWEEFEEYVKQHDYIVKLFSPDGLQVDVYPGTWIVKLPGGFNVPVVNCWLKQNK